MSHHRITAFQRRLAAAILAGHSRIDEGMIDCARSTLREWAPKAGLEITETRFGTILYLNTQAAFDWATRIAATPAKPHGTYDYAREKARRIAKTQRESA